MKKFLSHNNEIILRKACAEDAINLNNFFKSVSLETSHFGLEPDEVTFTNKQQELIINKFSQADNALLLIATLNNKIIGALSFGVGPSKKFQHVGEFGVDVLKDYWNLGVATELIKLLINWAKENKSIYKLNLRVRSDNENALHLYKKLGFKEEGILKNEMMCNGVLYDLINMRLMVN
ncbi:Protein N-acetyltransferase, RimJ/RimL family [Clostridium cavendishii DSM 21758]|uniref:Protein N-acetyltransferase, RimJ/RimL family n=1 Tax=Clostridium cavendishii DSM 21758 TaxID=1121302 RepID=A0A1M6H340_9CLOT|nr:GNAT family protein [Clostridium cavendishii]SHJ16552.1 Protein N-acetyltransferase, RimJ/RimL family [Clostridium cavendishii DSM 21758]